MRVLLDECVPRALRAELPGHEVKTVAEAGWAGVKNGGLLQLAAKDFDLLLTVDRNLEYQQNFSGLKLAVVVIEATSNDVAVLRPLMPAVREAISKAQPGVVIRVRTPHADAPAPLATIAAARSPRTRTAGVNHDSKSG